MSDFMEAIQQFVITHKGSRCGSNLKIDFCQIMAAFGFHSFGLSHKPVAADILCFVGLPRRFTRIRTPQLSFTGNQPLCRIHIASIVNSSRHGPVPECLNTSPCPLSAASAVVIPMVLVYCRDEVCSVNDRNFVFKRSFY